MEIVNYKVTVAQPDGADHVSLFQTEDLAERFAAEMRDAPGWAATTEEQRFNVEVGTVVVVRNSHLEITGPVREIGKHRNGRIVLRVDSHRRIEWWFAWELLAVSE